MTRTRLWSRLWRTNQFKKLIQWACLPAIKMFCLGFFSFYIILNQNILFSLTSTDLYWTRTDFRTMDSNYRHKTCRMDRILDIPSWQKPSLERLTQILKWKKRCQRKAPPPLIPVWGLLTKRLGTWKAVRWRQGALCKCMLAHVGFEPKF